MNGARQSWLVAVREIRERGRSRGFLLSVVVMLVGVAGAIVLPGLLDTGPGTKDVGLTGTVPAELPAALNAQGEAVDTTIRIHRYATVAAGEEAVRDQDVDVLVVDARQLEWRKRADEQLKAVVAGAMQLVAVRERAATAGIDPEELVAMVAPVPVTNVELGQVAGRGPDDEFAAFVMTLVLFGAISTYGAMVMSGVVEEKSSRTVEVLLARMPARNLLVGKIAGVGLLGLAQIAATALVALVAGATVDSIDIPAVRGSVLAWAVVWFLLGYALFATVFGTLGSLTSRTEDASSVSGPVTIVLVLAFMVSFAAIGSAETTWARLVSWFPVTAPVAMPNRIAMGAATWWDPIVAVAITLAAIAGLVVVGGRVYTRALLHTGATLTLGDAWRGTRPEPPAPTATGDTHDEVTVSARGAEDVERRGVDVRRDVAPIALAAVAGIVALLVSSDVIVAVAVATGTYAVMSRLGRRHGPTHASRGVGLSRRRVDRWSRPGGGEPGGRGRRGRPGLRQPLRPGARRGRAHRR